MFEKETRKVNCVKAESKPPFGESSSDIKLSRHRVNKRMEDWDVKYQFLKRSIRLRVCHNFLLNEIL